MQSLKCCVHNGLPAAKVDTMLRGMARTIVDLVNSAEGMGAAGVSSWTAATREL